MLRVTRPSASQAELERTTQDASRATSRGPTSGASEAGTPIVGVHRWARVSPGVAPADHDAARHFELRVPRHFLALADPCDPLDPLTRQFLPTAAENQHVDGFGPDPVGDLAARRNPALLRKYAHRALLLASPTCAIHCRYCFRRAYPYDGAGADPDALDEALDTIQRDRSLHEVILSGGDPLSLSDRRLSHLIARLCAIPHLRRLRLHSRTVTVDPARVTPALTGSLANAARSLDGVVVVLHVNHPRELSAPAVAALGRLRAAGVTLLNQSVLLAGVNDDVATLKTLSEALFAAGALPYYLHQLDRVSGAAHFAVPDATARALVERLRESLPGYLVPKLVRERAGAPSKTPL